MDISFDSLYNRILDVSAVIHITVKFFAMFIVVKYTPKIHRYHSYFVLNIMFWNFMCNFIYIFIHLTPLFPAECFRVDGLSSLLIDNEAFGHAMFLADMTATTHCGVAIVYAFPYRYIVFAHPNLAANMNPHRVVLLCCGVHVLITTLFLPLFARWAVSYEDYPEKAELPPRKLIFCYYPYGHRKIAAVSAYYVFVVVCLTVIIVFSILFLRKLRSKKPVLHFQTVALQRKLFISLVVITAIALLFGGIPLLVCVVTACFPYLPYARNASMVCIVFLCNHGSIYSLAYLVLFRAYRDAVKRLLFKFIGNKVVVLHVKTTIVHSTVVGA